MFDTFSTEMTTLANSTGVKHIKILKAKYQLHKNLNNVVTEVGNAAVIPMRGSWELEHIGHGIHIEREVDARTYS